VPPHGYENLADYYRPGQIDDCLENKLGIHDAEQLDVIEHEISNRRSAELITHPLPNQTFDFEHLKRIHGHLFGDVYEWAGPEVIGEDRGICTKIGLGCGGGLVEWAHKGPDFSGEESWRHS
jgi:hypothetical protein